MRKGTFRIIIWNSNYFDYEHVVTMYGGSFSRVNGWEQFREEVQKGATKEGLHVVEICTNRDENLTLHRTLWAKHRT